MAMRGVKITWVWHMRPTPGSTILSDSTSYRNHLTDQNGLGRKSGLAGNTRQLFGEPDNYLSALNSALENLALEVLLFLGGSAGWHSGATGK